MDMKKVQVKLETFQSPGRGFGVRVCFLYDDAGPEIFQKDQFFREQFAMAWGKQLVQNFVKQLPGSTIEENAQ